MTATPTTPVTPVVISTPKYYSQYQQDEIISRDIFRNARGGTFLDIGAFDGINLSNTYYFEKELGWKGVCIEPTPDTYAKLAQNRSCVCIQGGIAATDGEREFVCGNGVEILAGLSGNMTEQHRERLRNEASAAKSQEQVIKVQCYNINALCKRLGLLHINYCSIDTEGAEMEILESIDYSLLTIDVFSVENTYHGQRMRDFMASKGYQYAGRLKIDDVFVRQAAIQTA